MEFKNDNYSKMIMRELIKNPRISDNQISKFTKIPVKTVNRKRKILEEKGILNYFTMIDNGPNGTQEFSSIQIYILTFRYGIHRKQFIDIYPHISNKSIHFQKHIHTSYLGEKNGHLTVFFILESRNHMDIMEIFNVDILGQIQQHFGQDSIANVEVHTISSPLRFHHNYLYDPISGRVQKNLKNDEIFVS